MSSQNNLDLVQELIKKEAEIDLLKKQNDRLKRAIRPLALTNELYRMEISRCQKLLEELKAHLGSVSPQ